MTSPCPKPLPLQESTSPAPMFSGWPVGWYMFGASQAVKRRPLGKHAFGRELVAFRTASGKFAVLSGRCLHMGAELAQGCVVGESLRCPFHHWQFAADGRCVAMPAEVEIPDDFRQLALPATERFGGVYCYNGEQAAYPLPFFEDVAVDDLHASRPFSLVLDCPWYMVGANGVDVQHFATTHDRKLLAPPAIDHPRPDVHRTVTRFGVVGEHLRDRLTRLAGREVHMEVTDWSGTMFLVRATFRRTQTFGMVSLLPRTAMRTEVHVIVAVRRSASMWGRGLFDPINVRLRRWLIHAFLKPDVTRSAGTDCARGRLVAADRYMQDYFCWLRSLHGVPSLVEGDGQASPRSCEDAVPRRPVASPLNVEAHRP